jgi:amino acid adenylation domain-containing protein
VAKLNEKIKDLYPLTYIQEGMLFHNIMEKDTGAYFIQYVLGCNKKIDVNILSDALELLTLRYDVLRTAFIYKNTKVPVQVVMKERKCELNEVDISGIADKESEIDRIKKADMKRGFDLEKDTLLRVTAVNKGNGEYKLIWSIHHIIIDGWSNSIVLSTFFEYYCRLRAGCSKEQIKEEIAAVISKETSFGDYVKWVKKKDINFAKEYFRRFLSDYDNVAAFNRSVYNEQGEKKHNMIIYKAADRIAEKIKRIANTHDVTLNTVVETAIGLVIQKYSRLDDVVFGKVVSGREVPVNNVDSMVGIFINTIPQRIKTHKDMTVLSLLKNVQRQSNESSKYDYLGLQEINALSSVSSDLIKILFVYENYYVKDKPDDGADEQCRFEFEYYREQTNYDITLSAYEENENDFYMKISYNEGMYDYNYAMGILKKIELMLFKIIDNIEQKVQDIELILEEERNTILNVFNNTGFDYDCNKSVIDLFEEQVEKTPDNTAVVCENERLTYSELNRKANRIAHGLRKAGICNGDLVAVFTDKSADMVVMLLGIIKAGAAYVPIDTAFPQERIDYILNDCKPEAVLVRNVKIKSDCRNIIDFNTLSDENHNEANPEKVNKASDLLYVIYTSGTTGDPKGVMLEHKGVVNLREYFLNSMGIRYTDSVLQFAKYTFDGSVWEMAMALLSGAKLVVCTEDERMDNHRFMELVKKENVSVAALPPAFYNSLEGFRPRILITAGSEAIRECVEKSVQDAQYINSYGPTECTVAVTEWKCRKGDVIPGRIPIGKPILNTKVYIMDGNKLCGIGIPGEICVEGRGLARGYLNNEQLTKERFIKNPFGDGMLYRTGDLARWQEDGNIDYMGRIDKQVKIRGFRIEPAEIEEVLRQLDGVKDCAVIVREDETKEKYICAFVASENDGPDIGTIKAGLGRKLPEYMLPAYIMKIDSIPLNSNGKLDVKALPQIEPSCEEYIEPDNDMEKMVCEAFAEVLNLDKAGVTQNFFNIGGHSLRAVRLVNSIEAKTGVRIPVKAVFEAKTAGNIAAYILGLGNKNMMDEIKPAEKKEHYPVSGVQKRLYMLDQITDIGVAYNTPQCFELRGNIDEKRLGCAYQKLVDRHETLRTAFEEKGGELVQRIYDHIPAELVVTYVKDNTLSKEYESFIRRFDLKKAPLMRLQLVKTGDSCYLFLDTHHIISDGMSISIIMEELIRLYNGEKLEELPIQYKDYSEWLRKRDMSRQKEYWVNRFKDDIPVLNMPLDYKRPNKQSFKGGAVTGKLGEKLTKGIKELARKTKTTEYMVVLSGLMITLSKYSRQNDIAIGTVTSGRTNKEVEKVVGMFVNTLVMRAEIKEDMTYWDFLKQIKDISLNAYENQEYPFDELVEAVCAERDMSRNPLFDVVFAFQNNEHFKSKMDGVEIKARTDFNFSTAKFDLTFNIDTIDNEYELYLEYCTDLFKEDTVIRLFEHFREVLAAIVNEPDCRLNDIKMITPAEWETIKNHFNNTERTYPKDRTVAEIFEEQVLKTPDKTAVVFEGESLTYSQLNEKANCIAHKLRSAGIRNDDCFAILAEKGVLMIAGILGIVKAGAAYVPVDPAYPKERIEYLVHDCKAKAVLLYNSEYCNDDLSIIHLSDSSLYGSGGENPVRINKPEDLIYVIYTSGTTGLPKGVMVEHKSVLRLVKNAGYVPLNEETVILQTGQMSFDASTFEVWGALLNGGTLHLAGQDKVVDSKELEALIKREKINTLWLTSTLFNQMFTSCKDMFNSVKYLLIGGEKLSERHVKAFKQHNNYTTLINGYGPTESTTFTTTYTIPEDFDVIPIGKPISNTKVYIMDGKNLCGIDVPGELCIAGDGLARGYLNNDGLTKQKFIKNPFGYGMLYKSGDLARWRSDGNIEYLGRMDKQVKIRGFRIEPAEVEEAIRKTDGIKDCAVVVREDRNNEKALYAYLCSDGKIDTAGIKNKLAKVLPTYMIPSYIMQIDAIPVTKNGKINERELPAITAGIDSDYTAPSNEAEQAVCDIYAEILGLDKVSVHADFFNIGGHSLRVLRVINSIEKKTGVRLPVKAVFEDKTAANLAKRIMNYEASQKSFIPKAAEKSGYTMSSAQKRVYVTEFMTDVKTLYNIPMCLKLTGNVDEGRIINAYNRLIRRHEAFRTSFDMMNGELVQIISDDVEVDVLKCHIKDCDIRVEFERFIRPFDMKKPPLIRLQLVETESCHYLFLDMHHIISDGMSMNIVLNEFIRLYNGEQLEELRIQYKDYSEWMAGRDLQEQERY